MSGLQKANQDQPLSQAPAQAAAEEIQVPDVTTEGSLTVMMPPPSFFLEHEGRDLKAVPESEKSDHISHDLSSRRFGISKASEWFFRQRGEHQNLIDTFRRKGISTAPQIVPETLESDKSRFTTTHELTNDAVKADNYQYFLRNAGAIKTNIARVLLAKIDADRNLRDTFSDFFNNAEKWANTAPDVIIAEAENRLRKIRMRHKGEYEMFVFG